MIEGGAETFVKRAGRLGSPPPASACERWGGVRGEHLCWKSSMFWRLRVPHSILADQGVCEDDELSGHRDESDLGGFPAGFEALVERLHVGVEARGRYGRKIEDATDTGASAPDYAHPVAEP